MKPKVREQLQPRRTGLRDAQVREEIRNFLRALDSYPACAAKKPRVTFQQHLGSIFAAREGEQNSRRRH